MALRWDEEGGVVGLKVKSSLEAAENHNNQLCWIKREITLRYCQIIGVYGTRMDGCFSADFPLPTLYSICVNLSVSLSLSPTYLPTYYFYVFLYWTHTHPCFLMSISYTKDKQWHTDIYVLYPFPSKRIYHFTMLPYKIRRLGYLSLFSV